MSLDGKAPSKKCGIKVKGNKKWLTIIQNANRVIIGFMVVDS